MFHLNSHGSNLGNYYFYYIYIYIFYFLNFGMFLGCFRDQMIF